MIYVIKDTKLSDENYHILLNEVTRCMNIEIWAADMLGINVAEQYTAEVPLYTCSPEVIPIMQIWECKMSSPKWVDAT